MKDVHNIIDKEIEQSEEIQQAFKEHFEQHKWHINLPDGRLALVTEIGRQNPVQDEAGNTNQFVYFDSKHKVKFSFDPETFVATVHGDVSDYPEQLDEQWTAYK